MTQARPRAVVFYARFLYLNPGLPRLLAHFASGRVPGVTAVDVTRTAPADISEAAAQADVILIDQSIANAAKSPTVNQQPSYHICELRPQAFYDDVFGRLLEAPVARAFYSVTDLHEPDDERVQSRLVGHVDAFLWFFEKRPLSFDQVPEAYRQANVSSFPDPLERWNTIRARFPVRAEAWFAIDDSEFTPPRHAARWQACVPGAGYLTRKIAVRAVRAEGLSMAPVRSVRKIAAGTTRAAALLPATERRSRYLIGFQNRMQRFFVTRSSATFVCGGPLSYPVRKFLEVPAAGSALVAYPCVGFEDYGFADGVSAVTCVPEDAGTAMRRVCANSNLHTSLLRESRKIVEAQHTVTQRAAQIAECLFRLANGTFKGAEFLRGRYEFR